MRSSLLSDIAKENNFPLNKFTNFYTEFRIESLLHIGYLIKRYAFPISKHQVGLINREKKVSHSWPFLSERFLAVEINSNSLGQAEWLKHILGLDLVERRINSFVELRSQKTILSSMAAIKKFELWYKSK